MYTIRQTKNMELITSLDKEIFDEDDEPVKTEGAIWWVAYKDGKPVAFAGMSEWGGLWFFRRSGVMTAHRGKGLQRLLIKSRLRYAKKHAPERDVVTYTILDNHPSSNNLIATGFRLYEPRQRYVGKVLYWRRQPDNKGR
jgi:GNAT superfamily N-acetyltransferase